MSEKASERTKKRTNERAEQTRNAERNDRGANAPHRAAHMPIHATHTPLSYTPTTVPALTNHATTRDVRTCRAVVTQLSRQSDGATTPPERSSCGDVDTRLHLSRCPICRKSALATRRAARRVTHVVHVLIWRNVPPYGCNMAAVCIRRTPVRRAS